MTTTQCCGVFLTLTALSESAESWSHSLRSHYHTPQLLCDGNGASIQCTQQRSLQISLHIRQENCLTFPRSRSIRRKAFEENLLSRYRYWHCEWLPLKRFQNVLHEQY